MSDADADDDVTLWAGRLRAWPTPPPTERSDAAAERTDAPAELEQGTVLSPRRAARAAISSLGADDEPDETTVRGSRRRTDSNDVDDSTALAERRRRSEPGLDDAPGDAPDAAPGDAPGAAPDDGTAIALRRRSTEPLRAGQAEAPVASAEPAAARTRRASTREAPASSPSDEGRRARVPSADDRQIYRPRTVAPEHAVRAAPTFRTPQEPVDVATASAARDRRGRRRLMVGVVVGALLVALAIAALVGVLVLPA